MDAYVLDFQDVDRTKLALVGGKGANLGELSRIEGISVPAGFCVTTEAYKRTIEQVAELNTLLERLSHLKPEDREAVSEISGKTRDAIEATPVAKEIEEEIARHLAALGDDCAYAVRSSATAEDLPTASFAGQQDTYLNIIGKEAILKHIRKCWASLFTDRAVIYRMQNNFEHDRVHLSVVVQKMIFPEAAGIMFTADPVTSNRKVVSIDASFGLGEALVSGLVDADLYKVREGRIVSKKISTKKLAIYALKRDDIAKADTALDPAKDDIALAESGTREQPLDLALQRKQTLTDEQILALAQTGRRIEAYFGRPQDIEWCISDNRFYIVQSRPITTLYPLPEVNDGQNRVYMSLAHQQLMTDVMMPLGTSLFPIWLKKLSDDPVVEAGGRMYMDVSAQLASPLGRGIFVRSGLGSTDTLIQKALINVLKRKDYVKTLPRGKTTMGLNGGTAGQMISGLLQGRKIARENDASLIGKIIARDDAQVRDMEQKIQNVSGSALFDFIMQDIDDAFQSIVMDNYGPAIVGIFASSWLKKHMERWLHEKDIIDGLAQSLPNNVTSEMGLDLLDVADVVRQYPAVLDYFQHASDESFFADLAKLPGGPEVSASMRGYLEKYGMRCPGEIDITRARWSEKPTLLVPLILNNIKNFAPGSHAMLFEQKRQESAQKAQELISRLEKLPGGKRKAKKTEKQISVMRNFISFREYPKYAMMKHFYVYKQTLLREAARLVQKGLLQEPQDIYSLSFTELRDVVATDQLDYSIITQRKADYEVYQRLTPPRVMTSDGEIITGEYDTGDVPQGALSGVPVSAGIVEGRARIVLKLEEAAIEEGDILVAPFTDPSWTPLFVSIKGLVSEVGGMMTHGAVVAREYGLPAVVSVENATKRIKDGQKIRVNGTKGYVEILE